MNRKAIVTLATGPHQQLLEIALPSFHEFAGRHGYDVIVADIQSDRPASWLKVPALREALLEYGEALWLDADTVIVDPTSDLDAPAGAWQALVEHQTGDGEVPNCGVWMVRRPMISVLDQMWKMTRYLNHGWWEQAAMHELLGYTGRPVVPPADANELLARTFFLDNGWNIHPWDSTVEMMRQKVADADNAAADLTEAWEEEGAEWGDRMAEASGIAHSLQERLRAIERPRIQHATMLPDRAAAMRAWATAAAGLPVAA